MYRCGYLFSLIELSVKLVFPLWCFDATMPAEMNMTASICHMQQQAVSGASKWVCDLRYLRWMVREWNEEWRIKCFLYTGLVSAAYIKVRKNTFLFIFLLNF